MMQQFQINRIKAGAVCSQSRPEANARIRNCISSAAPGDIFSHVSTAPRTSLILPADNSAASSSGASSRVNNTRRKSKVRWNIPSHVCFLSDYCLKWAARWGGGLGPASLLKGPKTVQVSIPVHVNDRRCHGTIVFLPRIVYMFEAFMLLFLSRNICEDILRFSSCCLSPNSPLGVRQEIVCGTAAKTQPRLIKSRHSWFIPLSQPHEKKLSPGCRCLKKFGWETEREGALLSMKNESSDEKLLALLKKAWRKVIDMSRIQDAS